MDIMDSEASTCGMSEHESDLESSMTLSSATRGARNNGWSYDSSPLSLSSGERSLTQITPLCINLEESKRRGRVSRFSPEEALRRKRESNRLRVQRYRPTMGGLL